MIGLLGKKVGMTQIFDEDGHQRGVTLIEVGPCYVTEIRDQGKNGYKAVQLGFEPVREKRVSSPKIGQFKRAKTPILRFVREIRTDNVEGLQVGALLDVDNFQKGDFVDVEGISIGRGFQGVVKRLNYRGGEKAHGTKMGREPGSIGSQAGGRGCRKKVRKGKGMPGHMGNECVTVQNLKVMQVHPEHHLLAVKGAVPGATGGYLVVKIALKRGAERKWKTAENHSKKEKATSAGAETAHQEGSAKASSEESSKPKASESPESAS
ncbi:MAG: 50S ribosomal protein L3 [Candidatus Omnitrophota bacterium]